MGGKIPGAALVCLVLATLAATVALVPKWRKRWGWGRTGTAGPISGVGWAGIVGAFLLLAAALASGPLGWVPDPFFSLLLGLGGFALFIGAGAFDSVRNSRRDRRR